MRGQRPISAAVGQRIALRRVARGRIALVPSSYLFTDRGRPLPEYVYPFLCQLFMDGRLRLGPPNGCGGLPIELSPAGERLLAELGGTGACRADG